MKMVLAEPPAWANRRVDLNLEKPSRDDRLEVSHGDDGSSLFSLTVEKGTRNVVLNVADTDRLVLEGKVAGAGKVAPKKFPTPKDKDRNWVVEDEVVTDETTGAETKTGHKVFRVWLKSGKQISLRVEDKPGELTPTPTPEHPIHEVKGQPEMVFACAMAIHTGQHCMLEGPTGIAKTSCLRWLCHLLNYNLVMMSISRGTQDRHLRGEYAPVGPGDFRWMDGPATRAARLSQKHPTVLMFDELNRIGNVAEFASVYPLLDNTRTIELPERRKEDGTVERILAGRLYVFATANPSDDEHADYVGVKELDPAFISRFPVKPPLAYPPLAIEARALAARVDSLSYPDAQNIVKAANRIRESHEIRFPVSFREMEAWARALDYYSWKDAAEIAVVSKAASVFRPDIRNLLQLSEGKAA